MFYKISSVCQKPCRNIFTQDRKMDNLFVLLKASARRPPATHFTSLQSFDSWKYTFEGMVPVIRTMETIQYGGVWFLFI